MRDFPNIFEIDSPPHYKYKSIAAKDARIGWELCQEGRELPPNFKKGMEYISEYLGKPVTPDNCERLHNMYKILEDRKGREMTQVEYAKLLGVSEAAILAWESGRRKPNHSTWFLITFSTQALQIAARKARRT